MLTRSSRALLTGLSSLQKSHLNVLSTAAEPLVQERLQSFRTTETDPRNHTKDHIGQFYTLNDKDKHHLFTYGGIPKSYLIQARTFNETCMMIRQPSLDVINCLRNIDYTKPAVRFVLFGEMGSGKSLSMAHILHYVLKENFLIVHVPWVRMWMRFCKEFSNSETKEGFTDLNLDAAGWLQHFKSQNVHILSNPDMKTSQDHVWSKREITPIDSPLLELIDHGLSRVKYACDTVIALSDEIKKLSSSGVCKTLVAIDGFNAFFHANTNIYSDKKERVHPQKVTLTQAFMNLSKFDWTNGVIVIIADDITLIKEDQLSYLPRFLLGKDGFEHLDPFVPILVPNYSRKELVSCMDYYRERKWVTPFPGQDDEVEFISASNPYRLMRVTAAL